MRRLLFALISLCIPISLMGLDIAIDLDIIEVSGNDTKEYGIEKSQVYDEISKRLTAANFTIKNSPNLPKLIVHVKSIPADSSIATYVQVVFYQEAQLVHSKESVWAITWSQASMVIGPKENYVETVSQEVNNLVNSFIIDVSKKTSS